MFDIRVGKGDSEVRCGKVTEEGRGRKIVRCGFTVEGC